MVEIAFWAFALMVVGGALATVTRKKALDGVIALLVTMGGMAGLALLLAAPGLSVLVILLFLVLLAVLAAFAMMFLDLPETDLEDERLSKPGMIVALFFLGPLAALFIGVFLDESGARPTEVRVGDLSAIGRHGMNERLFEIESISLLLLVAVVVSALTARRKD